MSSASLIACLGVLLAPALAIPGDPWPVVPGAQQSLRASRQGTSLRPDGTAPHAESDVFEGARRSVFVVETESGHGSGFLVDAGGLIVTNHHLIGSTRYLAVGVDPSRKYPAVVVGRDAARDIALIRVHPKAVEGLPPLRFIPSPVSVRVGERVLAIGSALVDDGSVLTTGIVSRVAADTLIADLNVNPGSSGGPLLNLRGEVIGVCTFLLKGDAGPGLAGIVRAHVALPVVADATASLSRIGPPSFERLPVASPTPYPALSLLERAAGIRSASAYRGKAGGMRIDVLTPPAAYFTAYEQEIRESQRREAKATRGRGAEPQRTAYVWEAHTGQVEAVVVIRAMPAKVPFARERDDDLSSTITSAQQSAGTRFRSEFLRMRLFRDGVEVVPIVPGRVCGPEASGIKRRGAGCFGLYQYLPEAFAPGAELVLHVYSDDAPARPRVWKLPAPLVNRVWSDFEPWLATLACSPPCQVP